MEPNKRAMDPRPSVDAVLRRVYRKSRSDKSVENYRYGIAVFLKWMNTEDADGVIMQVESGQQDPVDLVQRYLDDLDARGLSPATQKLYAATAKKFFEVNMKGNGLNWGRLELPRIYRTEEDRIPTREEIKSILEYGNIKDRAVILFKVSSGVRDRTLAGLNIGDVDLEAFPDVALVKVRPEIAKRRIAYVTFITPEAVRALNAYLDLRRRKEEELVLEAPLFAYMGRRQAPAAFSKRWRRLLSKAGKDEKRRTWNELHLHVLRKFFRTSLELAGISTSFRERLMGHKGEHLDDAYFKPHIEQLLEEYRKAMSRLTIFEEVGITVGRLAELEEELKATKEALEALKSGVLTMFKRRMDELSVPHDKPLHEMAKEAGWPPRGTQMMVNEDELAVYLSRGWRFISQLNNGSGKCIVEK